MYKLHILVSNAPLQSRKKNWYQYNIFDICEIASIIGHQKFKARVITTHSFSPRTKISLCTPKIAFHTFQTLHT